MSGLFSLAGSKAAEVASALYFTDTPLTVEQARKLARVAGEAIWQAPSGQGRPTPAEYWSGVTQKGREFLSPPQVQALELLQLREEYQIAQRNGPASEIARSPSQ